MARFLLECPECAARIPLREYEPDGRVKCRKCRIVLRVPVVEEHLTPEDRERLAREQPRVPAELQAKVAKIFPLRRLLAFSGLLGVLVVAAVIVLLERGRDRFAPAPAKTGPSLEELKRRASLAGFPSEAGAAWFYGSGGPEEERRVTMTARSADDTLLLDLTTLRTEGTVAEQYEVTADGIYLKRRAAGPERYLLEPPMKVASVPLQGGDSWTYQGELVRQGGGGERWEIDYSTDVDSVEVPAGKFLCIRITVKGRRGLDSFQERWWLTPNVGLVKRTVDSRDPPLEFALTRYRLGRAPAPTPAPGQ